MKQKFNVTGMTCAACSAHVEKAVRGVAGVASVSVNLMTNSMLVDYDAAAVQPAAIKMCRIRFPPLQAPPAARAGRETDGWLLSCAARLSLRQSPPARTPVSTIPA